jgi:chondroitin AC lyase
MAQEIKKDKVLFDKTIKYLRWSYENASPSRLTGANGADIIMGSLAASVMTDNHEQMIDFRNQMDRLLSIQNGGEGVEPDYMFSQHSQGGKARQIYYGNYGKEFINSVLFYFEFCNNTQYNSVGISLLEDMYVNGVQWIFFNKNYDPNQAGRYNTSNQYYGQFESMTKRLLNLQTSRKDELKKVYERITGENSLTGNRMFWRFDYMINRRADYMVSTRMSSTRTAGSEAGLGFGEYNYYSGNGTNYIFVSGNEYSGDYFKKFNHRQFPGITAEQDSAKLPIPNWGENASNGNPFAGGVSDSTYGTCGMILDRRELQAHKSWFYFDEEFVCLGAGIHQTNGKALVYTTLNQCNANGEVQYSTKGKTSKLKDPKEIINVNWVLHGKIGYFNLEPTSTFVVACDSILFSANINHGVNPKNGTYAYIVKPRMESISEAKKYGKNIPVQIISNTDKIQAVKNTKLNVTEVVFYEAGSLQLSNEKSIVVDAPCALLWKENTGQITLANPLCETKNPSVIIVKIQNKDKITEIAFQMPTGVKSGSSVTKKLLFEKK